MNLSSSNRYATLRSQPSGSSMISLLILVIALLAVCKYYDLHALCFARIYKSAGRQLGC